MKIKHQFMTPEECTCSDDYYCIVCDGGLAFCKVCGLVEGSLTTDCPEEHVFINNVDAIYAGELDYIADTGWVKCSLYRPNNTEGEKQYA
jgi:hypothetical protein